MSPSPLRDQMTVVVATRDRRYRLLRSLDRLLDDDDPPALVVVDNHSHDGTAEAVRQQVPTATVVRLDRNEGACARNIGAATAATPYVAFNDDDSWWEPGSLARAARRFDAHPELALLAARVLAGPEERCDPVSEAMAADALTDGHPGIPGPAITGFLACAAAVRRDLFLGVGGFSRLIGMGGEEDLVAWDLASDGWALRYDPELVVHHVPTGARPGRRARQQRNAVVTAWLRRPVRVALADTARFLGGAITDAERRGQLGSLVASLPAIARRRHPLDPAVEAQLGGTIGALAPARVLRPALEQVDESRAAVWEPFLDEEAG